MWQVIALRVNKSDPLPSMVSVTPFVWSGWYVLHASGYDSLCAELLFLINRPTWHVSIRWYRCSFGSLCENFTSCIALSRVVWLVVPWTTVSLTEQWRWQFASVIGSHRWASCSTLTLFHKWVYSGENIPHPLVNISQYDSYMLFNQMGLGVGGWG